MSAVRATMLTLALGLVFTVTFSVSMILDYETRLASPKQQVDLRLVDVDRTDLVRLLSSEEDLRAVMGLQTSDRLIAVDGHSPSSSVLATHFLDAALLEEGTSRVDFSLFRRGRPLHVVVLVHATPSES